MTPNILPLAVFIFCVKQELVIMILILVPDKCIHKQMRRQSTWLGAPQKLFWSQFMQNKPKLYCTTAEHLANYAMLLYLSVNFLMQYLSIFKLAEILMCCWNQVLCLMIGMPLFANYEVGTDLFSSKGTCNCTYNFSRICPILWFFPSIFPVHVSCYQRKSCKDNVALLQW